MNLAQEVYVFHLAFSGCAMVYKPCTGWSAIVSLPLGCHKLVLSVMSRVHLPSISIKAAAPQGHDKSGPLSGGHAEECGRGPGGGQCAHQACLLHARTQTLWSAAAINHLVMLEKDDQEVFVMCFGG